MATAERPARAFVVKRRICGVRGKRRAGKALLLHSVFFELNFLRYAICSRSNGTVARACFLQCSSQINRTLATQSGLRSDGYHRSNLNAALYPNTPSWVRPTAIPMALTHNARCADCKSGQNFSSNPRPKCYRPVCAGMNLADAFNVPSQALQPSLQDPLTYYASFLSTGIPSGYDMIVSPQRDDDYTCHTEVIGAQGPGSQRSKVRAIASHMAVRMANRSNGAPLATIIEQVSYSTLSSRGSLLSVSRFPSIHLARGPSPARAAHRVSRNLDENTLDRIHMEAPQEHSRAHASGPYATLQDNGRSRLIVDSSTPMKSIRQELPQSPRSQISDTGNENEGCFPDVLRNVRVASQTRSRSFLVTHTSNVEEREGRSEMSASSPPHCQTQGEHNRPRQGACLQSCGALNCTPGLFSATPSTPILASQATNRKTSMTDPRLSASTPASKPTEQFFLPPFESFTSIEHMSQVLAPSVAGSSRVLPPSVRLVPPEPRDVACLTATAGASTLSKECNDSHSAQNAFYGVPVTPDSTSSLHKHNCAKEVSRNASLCSTVSTSYSGTVLGVDLDVQFKTPESVRQSSSPMPV
jgi:hypothetical protein